MMKEPERVETGRLILRRPVPADAGAIFSRYASDPEVTRYLAWPIHRSIYDTRAFLDLSEAQWERWPAGPYLIEARATGELLGSTGLGFDAPTVAMTGYVLARDAWGRGYASEALGAVAEIAGVCGVRRLYALCHPGNSRSLRVLEKCGFIPDDTIEGDDHFPNLAPDERKTCLCYSRNF